ncbi:MAG: Zn-ribbon containing protein, partial [Haloarculaceae archaeon]
EETPLDGSEPPKSDASPKSADPPEPAVQGTVARTVGKAAMTVRDLVGGDDPPRGAPSDVGAPSTPATTEQSVDQSPGADVGDVDSARTPARPENTAQASARGDVVAAGELPETPEAPGRDTATESGSVARENEDDADDYEDPADRPDLADLRAELNEQFESIKVLEPGQYELNLMELYDREEYIIALQEDGKYTIQVPEGYGDG